MFCQLLLDLGTRHLVIISHLLIYKSFGFYRQLLRSPGARKIFHGTGNAQLFDNACNTRKAYR